MEIRNITEWNWQISQNRVKQSEKRHFADPSIACSLLNIKEENKLINDLETFGFLFEAMVDGVYVVPITSLKQ